MMKTRTETELLAEFIIGTEVNLAFALGFYSKFGSIESLVSLEQKHEMVTAISVEFFPGVSQVEQKHIGKWREAIEVEMSFMQSETFRRPSGAWYLVGSVMAPRCKRRYPVNFVALDIKSTRKIVDQAFSIAKCKRMPEKSYRLPFEIFVAVLERAKDDLEPIFVKKFPVVSKW